MIENTNEIINYIMENKIFDDFMILNGFSKTQLEEYKKEFKQLKSFKINENVFNTKQTISENLLKFIRLTTEFFFTLTFKAMKICENDGNVNKDNNNLGTPARLSKMYVPKSLYDNSEPLSGRWCYPPKVSVFDNSENLKDPVTVAVSINAMCSHHLFRFGNEEFNENSKAIIIFINITIIFTNFHCFKC